MQLSILPIVLTAITLPRVVCAQQVVEPEQCILDTLKGSAAKVAAETVRWACVRQYIKAAEPKATMLPTALFANSKLQWFPTMPAFPKPIQERVLVTLKNDSSFRVIAADVVIIDNKTKARQTYKAYVDYPIDPGTVGSLNAAVMTGVTDQKDKQTFWKDHAWALDAVYGVAK